MTHSNYKNTFRKASTAIVMLLLMAIFMPSCQKNNNMGQLRGQWQILSIQRPIVGNEGDAGSDAENNAGNNAGIDMGYETEVPANPRLYLSFDLNVVQLTDSDDSTLTDDGKYIGQVAGENPDYVFTFPYNKTDATMALIAPWGFDENPVNVHIEKRDGNSMIMKVGNNILQLRKF